MMQKHCFRRWFWTFLGVAGLLASSCGNPSGPLTKEDRVAEVQWVLAKFEQNYAPIQYKQQLFNFNWAQKKAEYLAAAEKEMSNADFNYLVTKLVGEMKDAHTGVYQFWDGLPGKVDVAYLGFYGFRVLEGEKDKLYIQLLLPGFRNDAANYPLLVGDKVVGIDGKSPYDFVKEHCPRDLGQDESNKTAFLPQVALLNTFDCKLPTAEVATLSVERGGQVKEVKVPWFRKDYYAFLKEQMEYVGTRNASTTASCAQTPANEFVPRAAQRWNLVDVLKELRNKALNDSPLTMRDYFKVHYIGVKNLLHPLLVENTQPCTATAADTTTTSPTPTATPALTYIQIPNKSFDVRLYTKEQGKAGYIKIYSFMGGSQQVTDFKDALSKLKTLDAKVLILDLVDNGGGSLSYGLELANTLKAANFTEPTLEVRLNDNWLNSYDYEKIYSSSATARELATRRYAQLKAQQTAGRLLSDRFSFTEGMLIPTPSEAINMKVVIMANEMCASMCDIFTADLKDNNVVKIIGKKTMGAGGNVVTHGLSPRLGLMISQTESLVVRANGQYVENQGIEPDQKYEPTVGDLLDGKYNNFITTAVGYALGLQ